MDTVYISTAAACSQSLDASQQSYRIRTNTHPPESTGETTRTKGGSKGKLSCHVKKEVLKTILAANKARQIVIIRLTL